jgi:hypothetical protein
MPTSIEREIVHDWTVCDNEPELNTGATEFGWICRRPIGDDYTLREMEFWSARYSTPFKLLDYIDDGTWTIRFITDWQELLEARTLELEAAENAYNTAVLSALDSFSVATTSGNISLNYDNAAVANYTMPPEAFLLEDVVEEELPADYRGYDLNEPFEYGPYWYVVMEEVPNRHYYEGQVWFSEREGYEFFLSTPQRPTLFGSNNGFRIIWADEDSEPEPEYDPHDYDDYAIDDGYSVENEDADEIGEVTPVINTNIGRTVPPVSFEQEFSGNGDAVARRLYAEGFAITPRVEGYHNSNGRYERTDDTNRFCYIETDSSCGYELIFDRISLNSRAQAEKVAAVQSILKEFKSDGTIALSAKCGFHVHVDVSDWGMKEIVSAYHLWNYLEDPIFRFASAFWGTHRDEEVGGGYSTPVPKGHTTRTMIGRTLSSRRDALNFSPILNAMGNCSCNASFYEDWANCTCNLRQPTLEFRVFNATLNQRKIRAYLAFCVAFVNIAKSAEFNPTDFPEMRWQGTFTKRGINELAWEDCCLERIRFILEKFPLTQAEKTDIQYCLRNSSLDTVMELL